MNFETRLASQPTCLSIFDRPLPILIKNQAEDMSYFDAEEEEKKFHEKHPPCDGLRKEFIDCITQSDCFLKDGKNIKDCLHPEVSGVNTDCRKVQHSFFECKRSLIDMRTRFRGRKGY